MIDQIPILDLGRYDNDREALVKEIGRGYKEYGFVGFYNHGIDDQLVEEAYDAFRKTFALPTEVKQKYRIPGIGGARGYTGFGIEQAKDHHVPDLKEFWHIGRKVRDGNPYPDVLMSNVWPAEEPLFEEKGYALFEALDGLGQRILCAIALYLELEEHWFDDKVNLGNSILRPLHYPPITDGSTPAVRAAKHEDINLITLLLGSNEAGLEILARNGSWIPVTTIPGTIVVNIGDMLQRLTNGVLPSTPHRVVNPPEANLAEARYSVPFFLHPNPDFMIETLPCCVTDDNPNQYPEPVTAHEYLLERLREIKLL